MMRMLCLPVTALAILGTMTAGCAAKSDRYPSLSPRDFERVQGQFDVVDSGQQLLRPATLAVTTAAQVDDAVAKARARHLRFVGQSEAARRAVKAAAGTGPEDKKWSLALVEIADLDSRLGSTTSLLADLDVMYASATLDFQDRDQIAQARSEAAALVAAEDLIIRELVDLLGTGRPAGSP